MIDYYPSLVEAAIEFKMHSRIIIAKYKKIEHVPNPDDEKVPHSN
tara:strand:- start:90 stop:224 length:135 start_codon:yes stop_codon:yes gene_type:complete